MVASDVELLRLKLLALDLRLHEMAQEAQQTHLDVTRMETELDDRRIASLIGPGPADAGPSISLAPCLEEKRRTLDRRLTIIARAKQSRWKTRVQLVVHRFREIREAGEQGHMERED